MDNDDMRRIIEPLFSDLLKYNGVNTATPDIFVPRGYQTHDFFQNVKKVLYAKKHLILKRWQTFLNNNCLNALSTHEMYLRYVMFACDKEMKFSNNVFDGILSVCALVINFNVETLLRSKVNFCQMSVDIFMTFYKSTLKDSFCREGGFKQFAEYLRHHEYLASGNYIRDDPEKVPCPSFLKHDTIIKDAKCKSLAKEILSTTKIKLPTLISSTDLKVKLQAERQQQAAIPAEPSKCEMMTKDLKSKITASSKGKTHSIQKPPEATLTCEMQKRDSKRKGANTYSKGKVADTDSKVNVAKTDSKGNLAKTDSKGNLTKTDSKGNLTKTDSKGNMAKTGSKGKVARPDSKGNVAKTDSKGKVARTDSKGKVARTDSEQKMSDKEQKLKNTEASSGLGTEVNLKRETKTMATLRKPSAAIFKREKTETDWERKMTNVDSKHKTEDTDCKQKTTEASSNPKIKDTSPKLKTEGTVLQYSENLESEINNSIEDKAKLDWYENIVQAVIKYNNTKCSDLDKTNNQVQSKTNEFLTNSKFLLDTLKSLIETLENADEE